jgi:uncharacterized Zn finger protein
MLMVGRRFLEMLLLKAPGRDYIGKRPIVGYGKAKREGGQRQCLGKVSKEGIAMRYDFGMRWAPYVSVGQKLAKAQKYAAQQAKKQKRAPSPVKISGRKMATSFWGTAWCDNLAAYSDFSNRLPRGATYVRNGSVVDLVIGKGSVQAIVAGSETYKVNVSITPLSKPTWNKIKKDCSASIDSLIDLLGGRLSDGVMKRLTEKRDGCFPTPKEIKMQCSCPDYSYCCKHIAAVMYGIGNRLDSQPELLFQLRGVDHLELVSHAVSKENLQRELDASTSNELAGQDLGAMFGIELDGSTAVSNGKPKPRSKAKPLVANRTGTKAGKPTVKPKRGASPAKSTGTVKRAAVLKTPTSVAVKAGATARPKSAQPKSAQPKSAGSKSAGSKSVSIKPTKHKPTTSVPGVRAVEPISTKVRKRK